MWGFLRKLFNRCEHNWSFIKMIRLNELGNTEDDEILSSQEYSLQRCNKCSKTKYRRR